MLGIRGTAPVTEDHDLVSCLQRRGHHLYDPDDTGEVVVDEAFLQPAAVFEDFDDEVFHVLPSFTKRR